MSRPPLRAVAPLLIALASITPTYAGPPGKTRLEQVQDAYQKINQYQATIHIHAHIVRKGKPLNHNITVHVAFDRSHHQLKIEDAQTLVIVTGGQLLMRSKALPGQYLKIPAPNPLTYRGVLQAVGPMRPHGQCADLAMLLQPHPIALLSGGVSHNADPVALPHHRAGLRFAGAVGPITLTLDNKTHRIKQMDTDFDKPFLARVHAAAMHITSTYKTTVINKALPPGTFNFKTKGLKPVASVQQMMQNAQGGGQGNGQGAGPGRAGNPAVGKPLPALHLTNDQGKKINLKTHPAAPVIVLSFWASWSNQCLQQLLPETEHLQDWAQKHHKDVAIYAVNMGERAKDVARFWKRKHYTVPLLLDEQVHATAALHIDSIPCIVVIMNGKVQQINDNPGPKTGQRLETTLNHMIKKARHLSQTPNGLD